MRASSKRPKVVPSGVTPPPPSSTGDTMAGEPVDNAADVPLPPISDDSDIRCMLETVITVQAAH